MKRILGMCAAGLFFAGCGGATDGDQRPTNTDQGGGGMTGAGGAGPGYDGTASGRGKYGTVPDGGTNQHRAGAAQTNAPMPRTDTAAPLPAPPTPPQPQ